MIIEDFLDPIIIDDFPTREEIEANKDYDLMKAPLLLTHSVKNPFQVPKQWTGCLYGANNLICEVKESYENFANTTNIKHLKINDPTTIRLSTVNTIKVTIFSVDYVHETSFMLFIQDMFINCLYTTFLGNFVDEIVRNEVLKKAIANETDVLYIDDTIYGLADKSDDVMQHHPTEQQLASLVYLVRPKEVIGINGNEIPLYIREFCQRKDYFKQIVLE